MNQPRIAAVVVALTVVPLALAQERPEQLTIPPGKFEVKALLQMIGKFSGQNLICADRTVASGFGPIELVAPLAIKRDDAVATLANVLYPHSLAMLPIDPEKGVYEVVSLRGPRSREVLAAATPVEVADLIARPHGRLPVVAFYELQHQSATVTVNLLRPMIAAAHGPRLTVGAAGADRIVVRGLRFEVAAAMKLVVESDKPKAGAKPDVEQRVAKLEKRVARLEKLLRELRDLVRNKR
ncbi:MAG: hypothetical protein NXI31_14945 [bacterium]|nr:hypothetical protein [bacterium]